MAFDADHRRRSRTVSSALYGAGKAAEALKQPTRAKGYYKQLVAICKDAGSERPELAHARKMAH